MPALSIPGPIARAVAGVLALLVAGACAARPTEPEQLLQFGGAGNRSWGEGRIVFAGGAMGSDLYSVNPDGSDLRRLTDTPESETRPDVSPDGSRIVYLRTRADGFTNDVWLMDADGGRPRLRLEVPPFALNVYRAVWSPDGRSITISYQDAATRELRLATLGAGSGAPVPLGAAGTEPAWSPDGERLAYVRSVDGMPQLVTSRPDGSELRRRTSAPGCCGAPRWSPDGSRILFFTAERGPVAMHVASTGAGDPRPLATAGSPAGEAAWSPDGERIVYADVEGDLWVARADGGGATRIVRGAQARAGLAWSR